MDREREGDLSQFQETLQAFYDTQVGGVVFNVAGWVMKAGAVLLTIATLYIGLAVLTGDIGRVGGTASGAAKYNWAGFAFLYGVIFAALGYMARALEDDRMVLYTIVGGGIVYFGLPLGLAVGAAQMGGGSSGPNGAITALTSRFIYSGVFLWALGAVRACIFVADRMLTDTSRSELPSSNRDIISQAADKPLTANVHTKSGPLARCWELPHCIDFIREVCDAYEQKKSCWRLQSGCMCDAKYLYRALGKDTTRGVRADEAEWLSEEAQSMGGGDHERKLFCRECRIFLEHQRRKFRVLSPLSVPITAVLVYALQPLFYAAYEVIVGKTAGVVRQLWLSEDGAGVAQDFVTDMSGEGIAWALLVLMGLFLLSAVMRFIEWLTLEAML